MSPSESSKKSGSKRGGSRGALGPIRMEGLSDIGRAQGNEDRYLSREIRVGSGRTAYLVAIADGAKADKTLASPADIAIQTLDHRIQEDWDAFTDLERARAFLRLTYVATNAAIVSECGAGKAYTTLTVAVIIDGELLVAHVGDSRCYLVTSRKIRQLTRDHNSIAEELEKGASRDQAKGSASQASGDLLRKLAVLADDCTFHNSFHLYFLYYSNSLITAWVL